MNIILWVILGAVAGWIASMIMKTNSNQGTVTDIILGILGAVVGGVVFNLLGAPGATGFNIYSLVVATVGAVILIWISRLVYR